tara:strand:- start:415 stop:1743 length:1329 start_codon:yes stop_codon:yes gene_type:complete
MNWIVKRKVLIKSFFIDTLTFLCLFLFSNTLFYLDLTYFKFFVIFIEWVVLSYVFGRYYDYVKYKYLGKFIALGINFFKTLGISLSFIFTLKILNFLNFELGFLHLYNFYFIFYLSLVSSLINYLLSFLYSGIRHKNQIWLFLGSDEKLDIFKKEINYFNLNIDIKTFPKDYFIDPFNFPYEGVIVGPFFELNEDILLLVKNLKNKGINVVNIENWCCKFLERYPIDLLDENLLIQNLGINKSSIKFRIKRIGDILISLVLAIISIPIFLLCGLLIYLEDRGPIFYKQIRTGQYEINFEIIKLRTMKINAEEKGPQWSKFGDKRITKVGKILRLTRIDELPQLLSVLKGDMSLIGPRPERPEIDKELKLKISNYSLRYIIRPGLSGWAQVNFPYGASISDSIRKFSYDIYYLKHSSILLDFLICLRTIRMVFNAEGAIPKND